ncbi:MAG TPA: phosphoribosylanthranilate isomerase [Armatimonadota bacterium]|nr:phosphoribosylanthranilate isomerase [Armatimonadota bacterium]HPO71271.1 phosphoribosylanthranilate isomerase [Armatimonadota bacterium]
MRTRIKVCGITRVEDALAAVEAGADALGFVFAPSPRRVTPEKAREIISALPPLVTPTGVFVNSPAAEVAEIARATGLRAIQLHGDEPPDVLREVRARTGAWIARAFRVRGEETLAEIPRYLDYCDAILLDAHVPGAAGGTGQVFDWTLAARATALARIIHQNNEKKSLCQAWREFVDTAPENTLPLGACSDNGISPDKGLLLKYSGEYFGLGRPMFLAGGLHPGNVAEAVRQVRPYAVDVSSGVEAAPGVKDPERLRAFMAQVREADNLYR